ncbi:MAG: acyltransferase family protein [Pseudomonadota bacterium]
MKDAIATEPDARRYDLDWLRVFAFAVLIFYHVGMFYVTWDWHVKSVHVGTDAEWLMRLVNPWRLPILFFISGLALRFVADAGSPLRLARRRITRLGLPIVFGMAVVVAPQAYFELVAKGEFNGSFAAFFPHYLDPTSDFSIITPTWNHLWYVVYILVYTLLFIPAARPLSRFMAGRGAAFTASAFRGPKGVVVALALLAAPHIIIELTIADLFPATHNLVADWATHASCLTVFVFGFALAKDRAFWAAIDRGLAPIGCLAAALAILFAALWLNWEDLRGAVVTSPALSIIVPTLRIVAAWATILALFALAQRYLNRPSRVLTYATEAVFPWYILHQTILVAAGVSLTALGLPVATEVLAVLFVTFVGCALLHELFIRRIAVLRPLFGKRIPGRRGAPRTVAARSAS